MTTVDVEHAESEQPNAFQLLQRVIDAAKKKDQTEKTDAWADIHKPESMGALAEGWRFNTDTVSGLLSVLESIPGQVSRARSLRKAVQRLAEQQAK